MKSRTWLRVGFTTLILTLSLTLGGMTALGQLVCIDGCLITLADCTNQSNGGSQECEDNYDACVEDCLQLM